MKFSKIYRVMQREPRLVVPSLPPAFTVYLEEGNTMAQLDGTEASIFSLKTSFHT